MGQVYFPIGEYQQLVVGALGLVSTGLHRNHNRNCNVVDAEVLEIGRNLAIDVIRQVHFQLNARNAVARAKSATVNRGCILKQRTLEPQLPGPTYLQIQADFCFLRDALSPARPTTIRASEPGSGTSCGVQTAKIMAESAKSLEI